jgi:hypothetical protein
MTAVQNRALCCECGQLRTVSANHNHRLDDNLAYDAGPQERNGWRMTGTLKCSHCGTCTRHAVLRDNYENRDNAEREFMKGTWNPMPRNT